MGESTLYQRVAALCSYPTLPYSLKGVGAEIRDKQGIPCALQMAENMFCRGVRQWSGVSAVTEVPLHPTSETYLGKTFQFECRAGSPFSLVPRKNKSQVRSKRLICRIKCRPTIVCVFIFFVVLLWNNSCSFKKHWKYFIFISLIYLNHHTVTEKYHYFMTLETQIVLKISASSDRPNVRVLLWMDFERMASNTSFLHPKRMNVKN